MEPARLLLASVSFGGGGGGSSVDHSGDSGAEPAAATDAHLLHGREDWV